MSTTTGRTGSSRYGHKPNNRSPLHPGKISNNIGNLGGLGLCALHFNPPCWAGLAYWAPSRWRKLRCRHRPPVPPHTPGLHLAGRTTFHPRSLSPSPTVDHISPLTPRRLPVSVEDCRRPGHKSVPNDCAPHEHEGLSPKMCRSRIGFRNIFSDFSGHRTVATGSVVREQHSLPLPLPLLTPPTPSTYSYSQWCDRPRHLTYLSLCGVALWLPQGRLLCAVLLATASRSVSPGPSTWYLSLAWARFGPGRPHFAAACRPHTRRATRSTGSPYFTVVRLPVRPATASAISN